MAPLGFPLTVQHPRFGGWPQQAPCDIHTQHSSYYYNYHTLQYYCVVMYSFILEHFLIIVYYPLFCCRPNSFVTHSYYLLRMITFASLS